MAVSSTPDGDYRYLKRFRPLGHESRDIGQFIDDDGTPYLIVEDRPFGFRIATLSEDYLNVEKEVCLIPLHLDATAKSLAMLLKVKGSKGTAVIYMGDIWKLQTQWDSRYLWMPVEIGQGNLRLREPRPWTLDVKSGIAQMLK